MLMKTFAFCLFFLSAILSLASCNRDDDALPEPEPEEPREIPVESLLEQPIQVELNPYGNAPLSARATIRTKSPVGARLLIDDALQIQRQADTASTEHQLAILGLLPNTQNRVIFTLSLENGDFAKDTVTIETPELPAYLPEIRIVEKHPEQMEPGLTLCGFSYCKDALMNTRPFLFDAEGNIRWLLEIEALSTFFYPVKRLRNGHWIFGNLSDLYEYDMMGREINRWTLDGYFQHHEIVEKADGNLIVAVTDNSLETINDQIVEMDRTSGAIVRSWDLREVMDTRRFSLLWNSRDWLHVNSIWYDEADQSLVISGRHQGIFKVSYNNELLWILAPQKGWGLAGTDGSGLLTADYLLTAIDEAGAAYPDAIQQGQARADGFDWCWGQHAVMVKPNGHLLAFDNGFRRNFQNNDQNSYSRGVEFEVDEAARTVRQVWEYGRSRGETFYSRNISDADFLPQTGNRLLTSGNIHHEGNASCKIIEVSAAGDVLFEADLLFANLYGSGEDVWGYTDVVYRSERLGVYPR